MIRIGSPRSLSIVMPNVNSGPISSVEAPKPVVTSPFCSVVSSPAQPIDEIQTFLLTRGVPSGLRISLRTGAVFGSSTIESNVDTFTCPCILDCPARINTFSGLAAADTAPPSIRPRVAVTITRIALFEILLIAFLSLARRDSDGQAMLPSIPTPFTGRSAEGGRDA